MNPIHITETLKNRIIRYLLTTFDVNRDGQEPELLAAMRDSFNAKGALFNGPFLELTLPYITGKTLNELAADKVIEASLLQLECFGNGIPLWPDTPLFSHQEAAIKKLCADERNVIVSSGTGSGKTECFLIPILNDLLKDPSSGVRAVLIYPLNALVNDQLERLRRLLAGTEITFGKYTGELPQSRSKALKTFETAPLPNEIICRDDIQVEGKLPQILITNYAMLEYLLLRPADAPLFQAGKWKYIVLDEAHTHAGAQGIEVGLLIRRLRHRLNLGPDETRCIATSATLTDDEADEAAEFASTLFGVPFEVDDVIFGEVEQEEANEISDAHIEPDLYLSEPMFSLVEKLRQPSPGIEDIISLLEELGLISSDQLPQTDDVAQDHQSLLWHALRNNQDLQKLKSYMADVGGPIPVEKASKEIFGDRLSDTDGEQALFHLIELGALAREDDDSAPILPAKYHLFARPPQGIWVCLNPDCTGKDTQDDTYWSRIFARRRDRCDSCDSAVYPVYVCRTCGQTYVRAELDGNQYLAEADPAMEAQVRYFTWRQIGENRFLTDHEEDELNLFQKEDTIDGDYQQSDLTLCLGCQKLNSDCDCEDGGKTWVTLSRVEEIETSSKGIRERPLEHMSECPRCRDSAFGETEIATPISLYSTTPLSILTNELYRLLPGSTDEKIANKPGKGRKLLSFYDSRQGAARFAAFLQDAVNDQIYRHIIPEATRQLEKEKERFVDLEEVVDRCFRIAWDYRVFHNDPMYSDELGRTRRPSGAQRDRLKLVFFEQLIAELTTRRRRRQSLESLALLGIEYFEVGFEPDFSILSNEIGLDEIATRTLVEYLLDGLRNQKVIVLPEGINRDSKVFGRNKFSPRLVRSNPQEYEIGWIGKTLRQHRRQLIRQIYSDANQNLAEEGEIGVLEKIFEWLLEHTDLLAGSALEGYQLAYDRIFLTQKNSWYQCDQCQRINTRGAGGLVCPHPTCQGHLTSVEVEELLEENYYRDVFSRELIPMRVEEHTAQLDSEKGRNYQEEFKKGNINVLSCSTTFEMGIDLGDLQGVVLSNVPPTVSNYRQRAGRAGRRTSGTAFILSWASDRPHDQTYFSAPVGIISGQVRVPHLAADNKYILQRHINAILFSAFMRYRQSQGFDDLLRVGPFFDAQVVDSPHFMGLENWLIEKRDNVDLLLTKFLSYLNRDDFLVGDWVAQFENDFHNKGNSHYAEVTSYYNQEVKSATSKIAESGYAEDLNYTAQRFGRLLDRLRGEYLINYLSERGILPSYSFPLHTVELEIHPDKARNLRLQRDVRQAIREYAPGQEVVADKRIWKSIGLTFFRRTPQLFHYRICDSCNHLRIGMEAGMRIKGSDGPCPVCNESPSNQRKMIHQYVEPDGFRTGKNSGMPAGQYVDREINLMRSALIPTEPDDIQKYGEILEAGYNREGKLLYVNEGNFGRGFKICLQCGTRVSNKKIKCTSIFRGEPCTGKLETLTLGFQEETDTLRLSFHSTPDFFVPSQENKSFWLSLMYALLHGASQALQIERRDIDGVLFPRQAKENSWQQTVVLFDNVPGGAGHVRQIREEITKVLKEALRIANCVNCEDDTSCVQCLRDYGNQFEYPFLVRGPVVRFLEGLLASIGTDGDPTAPQFVVALDYPRWLIQTVSRSQQHVLIFADGLSLNTPSGELFHWLDVFSQLLKRGVTVDLNLTRPLSISVDEPESLSLARHLQILMEEGLTLKLVQTVPEWRIIIDENSVDNARALRPVGSEFVLNDLAGENGMATHTLSKIVGGIASDLDALPGRPITVSEISPPKNTRVINIDSSIGTTSEEALFSELFANPVSSMQINDRYLFDHYRIVERLGAYVQLAQQAGKLQTVSVYTWDADQARLRNNSREEQNRAIQQLQAKFPEVDIRFHRGRNTPHDRFVVINREDGSNTRIIIGKGLDFIRKDGSVDKTFVVIEDPFVS